MTAPTKQDQCADAGSLPALAPNPRTFEDLVVRFEHEAETLASLPEHNGNDYAAGRVRGKRYAYSHAAQIIRDILEEQRQTEALALSAPALLAALQGAIGALEFSQDYHRDLGNEEQAFAADKLDNARAAIARALGSEPTQ